MTDLLRPEEGSSPHVRGARLVSVNQADDRGIIPACAGSTSTSIWASASPRDHPRMCGEHTPSPRLLRCSSGSSPHVRGALNRLWPQLNVWGIIPACAGSTSRRNRVCIAAGDHPRMCGEHCSGEWPMVESGGSSPHVRGALQRRKRQRTIPGIIPACAGSTDCPTWSRARFGDHPRMCGEHFRRAIIASVVAGSSPHVRGAHNGKQQYRTRRGIIPACAGSTAGADCRPLWMSGIIPACAGSTNSISNWTCGSRDHPRMCGEHKFRRSKGFFRSGSSPHVRGARQP